MEARITAAMTIRKSTALERMSDDQFKSPDYKMAYPDFLPVAAHTCSDSRSGHGSGRRRPEMRRPDRMKIAEGATHTKCERSEWRLSGTVTYLVEVVITNTV
jgi:hypothetical protein